MNKSDIEKRVIKITSDILEIPTRKLSGKTNLVSDLGAESLDLVDLVVALEEEYSIEVADEDIAGIQTIDDIVNYIVSKQN